MCTASPTMRAQACAARVNHRPENRCAPAYVHVSVWCVHTCECMGTVVRVAQRHMTVSATMRQPKVTHMHTRQGRPHACVRPVCLQRTYLPYAYARLHSQTCTGAHRYVAVPAVSWSSWQAFLLQDGYWVVLSMYIKMNTTSRNLQTNAEAAALPTDREKVNGEAALLHQVTV